MSVATAKLSELMRNQGARTVAHHVGISERALRNIRDGAEPRASTRAAFVSLGILTADWHDEGADDGDDETDDVADDDLLARLTARYHDVALSVTERARAASTALRVVKRLPPAPSPAAVERLTRFAEAVSSHAPAAAFARRHVEAATGPGSVPHDVLAWCREAAREGLSERERSQILALEARAADIAAALDAKPEADLTGALASDIVERCSPLPAPVVAVFERFGLDPRPLAPPWLSVHYPPYRDICRAEGWRPREINAESFVIPSPVPELKGDPAVAMRKRLAEVEALR